MAKNEELNKAMADFIKKHDELCRLLEQLEAQSKEISNKVNKIKN